MTIDDAAELLDNLRNDGATEVPPLEKHDWVPVDGGSLCETCGKPENDFDVHTEKFCYYCAEPLEDGICSASCHDSEGDEGRECEHEDEEN